MTAAWLRVSAFWHHRSDVLEWVCQLVMYTPGWLLLSWMWLASWCPWRRSCGVGEKDWRPQHSWGTTSALWFHSVLRSRYGSYTQALFISTLHFGVIWCFKFLCKILMLLFVRLIRLNKKKVPVSLCKMLILASPTTEVFLGII